MSRSRIVIGLTLACLTAAAAAAQRPMTPIDLLEVPRLSEPQLSPDGRELVYVLAEADWKANKRIAHLWRSSTETGETIQLTRGAAGESTPRWSPGGEYIAFVTERGDDIYKATTPPLVLVGANDERVPPPQSVELYRALKSNGVQTHLYMAPREPHGWRELRHELFKINVELDWFEKHARGRSYEWVVAPEDADDNERDRPTENEP